MTVKELLDLVGGDTQIKAMVRKRCDYGHNEIGIETIWVDVAVQSWDSEKKIVHLTPITS
jgi:hypothetical protein